MLWSRPSVVATRAHFEPKIGCGRGASRAGVDLLSQFWVPPRLSDQNNSTNEPVATSLADDERYLREGNERSRVASYWVLAVQAHSNDILQPVSKARKIRVV